MVFNQLRQEKRIRSSGTRTLDNDEWKEHERARDSGLDSSILHFLANLVAKLS